ncbi:class I SAM-dependent methyltransferase [Limibacillus halophilus]
MAGSGGKSLEERLKRRIALEGPITLADYMTAVLTDPKGGYYMEGEPFGAEGDFITAPEVSQMFGEMLGLWCIDAWQRLLGAPKRVILAELGPGRGTLMADVLRTAKVSPDFAAALEVHLVEVSPALREKQKEALAGHKVVWHKDGATLPESAPLLLLANEFFDALPLRHFEKTAEGWRERMVGLDDEAGRLVFHLGPVSPAALPLIPPALHDAPPGSLAEVSPAAVAQAAALAERLAEQGGAALVIDYGRAHPAFGATLQAVKGHERHDPLEAPGSADLTGHVDFPALIAAAEEAGAAAFGPVTQGDFLRALGIELRAERLKAAAPEAAPAVDQALHRLLDAEEMGELFKVAVITARGLEAPAPFVL